jgi:SAM-dependent methyltransferase
MLEERDLIREISPDERVFQDSRSYFIDAITAVDYIDQVIEREPQRILDLPSGHGRVMRALKARFPRAELVACDILEGGVQFCAETFGAVPVHAPEDPRAIDLEGPFDLIWVGSLFTHLRPQRWTHFMDCFCEWLAPGGTLVATTHGRHVARVLQRGKIDLGLSPEACARLVAGFRSGFAYENYRKYPDYGISLSQPWWVVRHLQRPRMELVSFTETGWADFQDVYAARKSTATGNARARQSARSPE